MVQFFFFFYCFLFFFFYIGMTITLGMENQTRVASVLGQYNAWLARQKTLCHSLGLERSTQGNHTKPVVYTAQTALQSHLDRTQVLRDENSIPATQLSSTQAWLIASVEQNRMKVLLPNCRTVGSSNNRNGALG